MFAVSAATHKGFEELLNCVAQTLEDLPESQPYEEEEETADFICSGGFEVSREGNVFVVSGFAAEQLIESVNFEDRESLNWFHRTMRKSGIIDELRRQGAQEGSVVRMADMEFDFIE